MDISFNVRRVFDNIPYGCGIYLLFLLPYDDYICYLSVMRARACVSYSATHTHTHTYINIHDVLSFTYRYILTTVHMIRMI